MVKVSQAVMTYGTTHVSCSLAAVGGLLSSRHWERGYGSAFVGWRRSACFGREADLAAAVPPALTTPSVGAEDYNLPTVELKIILC